MSLKEQLFLKQSELAELKAGIDSGDAEAVASAKSIMDEIDGLNAAIEVAEKSNSILASIKSNDEVEVDKTKNAKSLGHAAAELVKGWKSGDRINAHSAEIKDALQNTDVVGGFGETEITHRVIEQPHRRLVFADLFAAESLSGSSTAKEIVVEKPTAGDFSVVSEAGKKPQISWEYDKATVSIEKIAGFIKLTDEFVEDAPFLVSVVNGRLAHKLAVKEEDYLVGKLLGTSGLQTLTYDPTNDKGMAEAVLKAQGLIGENTDYQADAVVFNPIDYEALRLVTDSNGQYYGGGFFQGEYGNGDMGKLPVWGLRTLTSPAVAQGTAIVGDFATAAAVLRKGGVRVDMTNSNEDDFVHNLVLTRLEERVGLAVYVPSAFVIISAEGADTDTDTDSDTE